MKTFLHYVAQDIIDKYGTDLSRVVVVFPNKRASLFLNEELARCAGRPVWAPTYLTISDLFRRYSTLTIGDPIKLVCELRKSYVSITGKDETLDHFFEWGKLLISDFDDMDKNMTMSRILLMNRRNCYKPSLQTLAKNIIPNSRICSFLYGISWATYIMISKNALLNKVLRMRECCIAML